MKRVILFAVVVSGVFACKNFEPDFPDFDHTTVYFPYQYPVRTLILGNYIYDNSNDNAHKFLISATMGGVRANTQDRICRFAVDENLCENVYWPDGSPVLPLPKAYYSLPANEIIIPSGKIAGGVEVQLTDAFFDDPLAITNTYAVPLVLTEAVHLDSILRGKPARENADRRIEEHWEIAPKDFTLFAVKFVNPYSGIYLHCGKAEVKNAAGNLLETAAYSTLFVEDNEVWTLHTSGRRAVSLEGAFKAQSVPGFFRITLDFDSDDCLAEGGVPCTVREADGASHTVVGNGRYLTGAESFGGKQRDAIYLEYTVSLTDGNVYTASDTLIFRDKSISMEIFLPEIK